MSFAAVEADKPRDLEISDLSVQFGGVQAVDDFSLTVRGGDVLGLIGPNGAGKTTLFDAISGFVRPRAGRIRVGGHSVVGEPPWRIALAGVARSFQEVRLLPQLSAIDNILLSFSDNPGEQLHNAIFRRKFTFACDERYRKLAYQLLEKGGLSGRAERSAGELSYGQKKMLSVLCCMTPGREVILLDEPVAGLAPPLIEKVSFLIEALRTSKRTVVIVEHSFSFISAACNRVVLMDRGRKIAEGTPTTIRPDRRLIAPWLGHRRGDA